MKTTRRTLRGIVTSSMLTLALAVGMLPAGALAFAAEQSDEVTDTQTEVVESDNATETDVESQDVAANETAPADFNNIEDNSANEVTAANSSHPAASQYTSNTQGITSADVPLTSGAQAEPVAGTIEYAGIAYTINPDDPSTVSVTGLATDKPKGDVQIQSQVASDGKLYTVSAIEIVRGGVHR